MFTVLIRPAHEVCKLDSTVVGNDWDGKSTRSYGSGIASGHRADLLGSGETHGRGDLGQLIRFVDIELVIASQHQRHDPPPRAALTNKVLRQRLGSISRKRL